MRDPASLWDADHQATLRALVQRADRGDQTALPGVRQVFAAAPGIWDAYGDLAATAQNVLVNLVAGKSALTREALQRRLAAMRAELEGPNASPLEGLLVERVVACWLQSYSADLSLARALKELPLKDVEYFQRRQDQAARQYLKALVSLAQVRRLLAPPVQVNVAQQQVNVAGGQVHFGTRD
ncbi:MAG: hypothetical protein ACLQBX_15325 [Candidatus Limnocylindrales bacterium]